MKLDRRQFSAGAVAAAGLFGLPGCEPVVPEDEDLRNFLAEGMNEGVEAGVLGTTADLADIKAHPELIKDLAGVKKEVLAGTLKSTELLDADSVDYGHFVRATATDPLGPFGADGAFTQDTFSVDHDVLQSIVSANTFDAALKDRDLIVIGLRGAELSTGDRATGTSIDIRESKIDHVDPHCLVGVWRPADKTISLFAGSTVPNIVNMQMFLNYHFGQTNALPAGVKVEAIMCGQLPQGVHTYKVGTHLAGNGDDRQMGCLRQDSASPVIRARTKLHYSTGELWDPIDWRPNGYNENSVRVTNVNIHSTTNKSSPPFASAGCTTVVGRYSPKPLKTVGAFQAFQEAMGIAIKQDGSGSNQDGTVYRYMLVTAREARLHRKFVGDPVKLEALRRLRIGSSGPAVAAMRKKIYGPTDTADTMDGKVMHALIRQQAAWGVPRDAMWTPGLDAAQGVGAWTPQPVIPPSPASPV